MARRTKREPKPAKSNRGRLDARGVFIIFDRVEDEPIAREASAERATAARPQREVDFDEPVGEELRGVVPGR
jgi:hypothetical protein